MAEKKSDLERVRAMLEQAHKDGDLSAEDLVKQMQLLDEKNTAEIEAFIRYQKQHGRKQMYITVKMYPCSGGPDTVSPEL